MVMKLYKLSLRTALLLSLDIARGESRSFDVISCNLLNSYHTSFDGDTFFPEQNIVIIVVGRGSPEFREMLLIYIYILN